MTKSNKAQLFSEPIKYILVVLASMIILISGYALLNLVKERACSTEIARFETEVHNIDKQLRFGQRDLLSYNIPCKADQLYLFDLNKNIDPEIFKDVPIIKDTLKNKGNYNVFLVKDHKVKSIAYAGNLEIENPYYLCLVPKHESVSVYGEGAGRSIKIIKYEDQPECV